MACCLAVPSHYPNQYWPVNRGVLWGLPESNSQRMPKLLFCITCLKMTHLKLRPHPPVGNTCDMPWIVYRMWFVSHSIIMSIMKHTISRTKYVWDTVFAFNNLTGMFLSTDVIFEHRIKRITTGPLYIRFTLPATDNLDECFWPSKWCPLRRFLLCIDHLCFVW